jgi:hypothetical protein
VASVEGTRRGEPVVQPLFSFRPRAGGGGRFQAHGGLPRQLDTLAERGQYLGEDLFEAGVDEA